MTNPMEHPEEHLTVTELDERIDAMQEKYRDGTLTAQQARELQRLKSARTIISRAASPHWD